MKALFVELPAFEKYWWDEGLQCWLFTLYDKDEASDLTPGQRKLLKEMVKAELKARSSR
jgi:predicted acetyltransferase